MGQVGDKERELKHKLRPRNAFLQAEGLNLPAACPREELHQFLIGLYGEYVIPSSMHKFIQVLRGKELYLGQGDFKRPLVTDQIMMLLSLIHISEPTRPY